MSKSQELCEFELSDTQLEFLKAAHKPAPYMVISGGEPMFLQKDNILRAWETLGKELGFEYRTARPSPGKDQHFFLAVPMESSGEMADLPPEPL